MTAHDAAVADDQNSYAMRHRARRAAQLAAYVRRTAEEGGMRDAALIAAVAAHMADEGWQWAAAGVAVETGAPFKAPSETTKQMCIGLLSMPSLEGLVNHAD